MAQRRPPHSGRVSYEQDLINRGVDPITGEEITEMVYGKKGKWVPVTAKSTASTPESGENADENSGNTSPTTPSDSQAEAEAEYKEIEYNTLQGDISVIPTLKTMKLKVGDTVTLKGIGKYLSGQYFISNIKRSLSDNGYSQTMTLIKTGFGDSLKKPSSNEDSTKRTTEIKKTATDFKVGDKVKIVGDDAIYSNADEGVRVPDCVKEQTLTVDSVSSDGTRVRLQPIWSWTYTKFIQKV